MKTVATLLLCLVIQAVITHASDGVPSFTSAFPKSVLENLLPAEQEVIDPNIYLGSVAGPIVGSPFSQSVPVNLTVANITAPDALPTFAVIGDFMGATGFHYCDIEHYGDVNHTLPPCPPRAGWALKLAAAYNDNIFLVNGMIRSTHNAERVSVPLLFKWFNNDTSNLKLVIFAIGSKYGSLLDDYALHLANMVNMVKARGIPVILMTRPPINPQPTKPLWFNMVNATAAKLIADTTRQVAVETGVACVDVYNILLSMGEGYKVKLFEGSNMSMGKLSELTVSICECCVLFNAQPVVLSVYSSAKTLQKCNACLAGLRAATGAGSRHALSARHWQCNDKP